MAVNPGRWLRTLAAALILVTGAFVAPPPAQAATGRFFYGTYISIYGTRDYHGYLPSTYRPGTPIPLVVALHGCTENDVGFDLLTGWSARAEQKGFAVVMPDQSNLVNPAGCWNWMLPTNQRRGFGEPAIISGITNRIVSQYGVDRRRVHITGISAGGVMANIMAVSYPDVYAAASIVAGCEYLCDPLQLTTPQQSGQAALREMGSRARKVPVVIFQGTNDLVVRPSTAYRVAGQWTTVAGADATPDQTVNGQVPGGRSYTLLRYHDNTGRAIVDQYMINGAGHAYPGGCSCSIFGDPSGPDATGLSWDYFVAHPMP
ncbi:esterase, PHB depolymerase family [Micromonospora pallida]|uniref:Esterase, PHB depolymerase family n=1 Tax=Micromonospora pallida TaxID=145854 RepID=A0A1C6SHA5_9ACTN|nr:PHB depolymerase family esterase [Micromonospora pallida]SCL28728.1 esterase, PHB depolymerase family [Micromonospora pallida]